MNNQTDTFLKDVRYTRSLSLIKCSALVVMAFDGNTYNWNNIAGSTGPAGPNQRPPRQGEQRRQGRHVQLRLLRRPRHPLSTEPFTKAGTGTDALSATKQDAIFWLHDQY